MRVYQFRHLGIVDLKNPFHHFNCPSGGVYPERSLTANGFAFVLKSKGHLGIVDLKNPFHHFNCPGGGVYPERYGLKIFYQTGSEIITFGEKNQTGIRTNFDNIENSRSGKGVNRWSSANIL